MAYNYYGSNRRIQPTQSRPSAAPATSPYGFVPFGTQPDRSDIAARYADETSLLSGWLDVKLTAVTSLVIPDATKQTENYKGVQDHKFLPFFRTPDGVPCIPGSELRGLLRSVYETASNSCVPFVLNDEPTSMRLPRYVSLQERGLLGMEKGKWVLWSANDYPIRVTQSELNEIRNDGTYQKRKPGGFYYFKKDGNHVTNLSNYMEGAKTGYLQFSVPITDRIDSTHHYSVHYLEKKSVLHTWDDATPFVAMKEELDHRGDEQRRTIKDKAGKIHEELLRRLKKIKDEESGAIPVWYLRVRARDGERFYLSPSSIGRINQLQRWKDIMGAYGPCACGERSCPACQLFGQVNGDWISRGRVRVGDAIPCGEIKTGNATLPILGGPKPSAFEMYIRKPANAHFWNYDIQAHQSQGREKKPVFEARSDFTPRGRKFYWHSQPRTENKKEKLNATVEYADAGSAFIFRVYFDRVTPQQLRQLIWVIALGENRSGSALCHKLGHGKPVGYGSAKLTVEKLTLRRVTADGQSLRTEIREKTLPQSIACPFPQKNKKQLEALLSISRLKALSQEQTNYPRVKGEIYEWFSQNRKNANSVQALPEITELAAAPQIRFETQADAENLMAMQNV